MFRKFKTIGLIVKSCLEVKPGQRVLIITDDYTPSLHISQQVAEVCSQEGAEVVLAVMEARTHYGHEPPKPIAKAMEGADTIFHVAETFDISHTDAAQLARDRGAKYAVTYSQLSDYYFDRRLSFNDLKVIRERTERLADIVSHSEQARIASPYGTELTMNLQGRKGLPVHPLGGAAIVAVPDLAEVAVSPVEGSTEGVLVVDASVQGWNFLLREPLRMTIKKGRVTDVSGPRDYVERLRKTLAADENAANCAAELGIATSHTLPKDLRGWSWDYGVAGTLHIAVGRNNDLGGQTFSLIHNDLLLTRCSLWLDSLWVLENGVLKV